METGKKYFCIETFKNPPLDHNSRMHKGFQIYYCQRGRFANHLAETSAHLTHGDIVIMPPDTEYRISVEAPYTVYYILSFSDSFLHTDPHNNALAATFLQSLLNGLHLYPKVSLPPDEIVFFECSINKILSEHSEEKSGSLDVIRSCLEAMLTLLSRTYRTQSSDVFAQAYTKKNLIEYCISYIDAHCSEDISLSEITKLSAMSKAVFCELFKQETGLSFKDYLNRKRIQKAIALLKSGEKITETSYICGYNDFSTFYRNFIKFTGTSPQAFRQRLVYDVK